MCFNPYNDEDINSIENSVKVQAALIIIHEAKRHGDKLLLFSHSLATLGNRFTVRKYFNMWV